MVSMRKSAVKACLSVWMNQIADKPGLFQSLKRTYRLAVTGSLTKFYIRFEFSPFFLTDSQLQIKPIFRRQLEMKLYLVSAILLMVPMGEDALRPESSQQLEHSRTFDITKTRFCLFSSIRRAVRFGRSKTDLRLWPCDRRNQRRSTLVEQIWQGLKP